METKNFKSVAFGGFDKEEVIQYIQQMAQEHTQTQEALQKEVNDLRAENEGLKEKLELLQQEQADSARKEAETLRNQISALTAQLEELRPQAESYQQVRAQVGDIEYQARRRATELESSTTARLNALVSDIQRQYQDMAGTFNTTAAQVTAELRKIEVNLAQLPRAMDQTGKELQGILTTAKGQEKR